MGKFDDYINSLEGKNDLDPVQIARDLHTIYNEDISVRDAKIEEQNGLIAERDEAINAAGNEVKTWKAKNFDLAMQLPGSPVQVEPNPEDDVDPSTITVDDLFVK